MKNTVIWIGLVLFALYFLPKLFGRASGKQLKSNADHLNKLRQDVKLKYTNFLNDIQRLGYTPVIIDSVRTEKEQNFYHRQDKRNPPAGHSSHEIGIAIDMNLYQGKKVFSKHTPKDVWLNTGVPQLAKEYGFRWGGDFKGYADNNHFDNLKR